MSTAEPPYRVHPAISSIRRVTRAPVVIIGCLIVAIPLLVFAVRSNKLRAVNTDKKPLKNAGLCFDLALLLH
jgi:hypothetical protein